MRSECNRDYHLHRVFTVFTANFWDVLVIKVVSNVAVEDECFLCCRYRVQSVGLRPTDMAVQKYVVLSSSMVS